MGDARSGAGSASAGGHRLARPLGNERVPCQQWRRAQRQLEQAHGRRRGTTGRTTPAGDGTKITPANSYLEVLQPTVRSEVGPGVCAEGLPLGDTGCAARGSSQRCMRHSESDASLSRLDPCDGMAATEAVARPDSVRDTPGAATLRPQPYEASHNAASQAASAREIQREDVCSHLMKGMRTTRVSRSGYRVSASMLRCKSLREAGGSSSPPATAARQGSVNKASIRVFLANRSLL